nr:hypothetical protein 6 [Alphaproteobacteria bacterium]
MGIDIRGLLDFDWASHLFDVTSKKGKFNYFIDEKGKYKFDGVPKPVKMSPQEVAYIDSVMLGIKQMTELKPKRVTNANKSTFDIQKFKYKPNKGILGVAYLRPWGNLVTYSDAYKANNLQNLTRETIDHEIGHAIGLSHPYGVGNNSNYTTADTVMSYNSLYYEDNTEMYFGFTPSDNNAISYWWGNTNARNSINSNNQSPAKISGNITIRTINKEGQGAHGIETFDVKTRKLNLSYDELTRILGESRPRNPFILSLNGKNNTIDASEWGPKVAKRLSGFGRISIHGNKGDDELIINGEGFKKKGFQIAFSGGKGEDKVSINNIDNITGSAGLLFGFNQSNPDIPKAIRFFGPSKKIKYKGEGIEKIVKERTELVVWEDVEQITIGSESYSFNELHTELTNSGEVLLTDMLLM